MIGLFRAFSVILILGICVGCGNLVKPNSESTAPDQTATGSNETPGNEETPGGNEQSGETGLIESPTLRQELLASSVEYMQSRNSKADPGQLRKQMEPVVGKLIEEYRQHYPDFLRVTRQTENLLVAGKSVPDAEQRISVGKKMLAEFDVEVGEMLKVLVEDHEAGKLSPERTELLAHFMIGDANKLREALTN